jgi:hypothetical protein
MEWKQKLYVLLEVLLIIVCSSYVWVNRDEQLSSVKLKMTFVVEVYGSAQFSFACEV